MRLFIGLSIILILFLIFGIYTTNCTLVLINEMRAELAEIKEQINDENWSTVQQNIAKLEKRWNTIQDQWDFYILHQEIESVEMLIARLVSYVSSKDKVTGLAELSALDMQLSHIYRKEIFNMQNIF